ncbi:MAG: sugar ABC transporter permease [Ruminococcaceae bacterium]|jgi:putative aldouronate transport system permease protein|nr:sugar ABC transporter permease [Oscillospiraceae bacterium]
MKSTELRTSIPDTCFRQFIKHLRYDFWLYAMLLPGLIYFVVFCYLPLYGISIAFRDYNIARGFANAPFIGMEIFEKLFSRSAFIRALTNNIRISLMKIVLGFPLPIILSLIINEVWNARYKRFVQSVVILPSFISWFVIYGILVAMCNLTDGVIPTLIYRFNDTFGTNFNAVNFMTNKNTFDAYIMLTYIWKEIGMGTVVYLAAIVAIDQQLYEAAMIDGAGRLRQIWHITLASLRPIIITLLIFRVGNVMNAGFDQIFALSNSLVISVADIIDTYVYRIGMEEAKFSMATAAGLFKSVIGLVLVLITNALARRVDLDSAIM